VTRQFRDLAALFVAVSLCAPGGGRSATAEPAPITVFVARLIGESGEVLAPMSAAWTYLVLAGILEVGWPAS